MTDPRLALRPGVGVVRREAGTVQVGLDAPRRVVLPDSPEIGSLLVDLTQARLPRQPSPVASRALRQLEDAGLLVDPDRLVADRARIGPTATSLYARHGRSAPDLVMGRARARVGVVSGRGIDVAPLLDLLARSGVPAREVPDTRGASVADPASGRAVCVVASAGPLPREVVDPLVAAGTAHLVLEGGCDGLRLGPFVVPGRTACLRCVDAHLAEHDPRRPLLVEQLAGDPRAVVPPDPVDVALALAWAVRDLLAHLDGGRPATWSATVDLGTPGPPRTWSRHPHCGCAWDLIG